MTTTNDNDASQTVQKAEAGASWVHKQEQLIPENRLGIVLPALMSVLFLAALDQTIVATALPTIVAHIGGGYGYGWVGAAFLIAGAAIGPMMGKFCVIFGRKPVLYTLMALFILGSALCGAARNMPWLIGARTVQGMGGSGVIQISVIIVSDIVPLNERARVMGIVGATYGIASLAGPLLGGAFSEYASWRWCFYFNLPIGGTGAAVLFYFLNLNPHKGRPFRDEIAEFDFIGLICFFAGVICLLLGFNFSQTNWSYAKTIAPLVVGVVLLVLGAINELLTTRSPILPARLFKTRTTTIILVTALLHAFVFFATSYYLTLFYQVLGASATRAGVKMLSFTLLTTFMSAVSGVILKKTGKYRPLFCGSFALMTLGFGLMILLNYKSSLAEQEIFPLIAALGTGCMFQVPMVAIQAAMPQKDMSTASSAWLFARSVGGCLGIFVGEAIITTMLPRKLAKIPGFESLGLTTSPAQLNAEVGVFHSIPNITIRNDVLSAWSQTFRVIWILCTALMGFSMILSVFLREYMVNRRVVRNGDAEKSEKPDAGDPQNDAASSASP